MLRWINGRELIEKYGLKEFELFELVRSGLQPFSHHDGTPVKCPQRWHLLTAKSKRVQELRRRLHALEGSQDSSEEGPIVVIPGHGKMNAEELCQWHREEIARTVEEMNEIKKDADGIASWKYLAAPKDDGLKKLTAFLCIACYKRDDVEQMAQLHGLTPLMPPIEAKFNPNDQKEETRLDQPVASKQQEHHDQLDATERRELGRLRQEELKRDVMLRATAYAMEYCIDQKKKTSNKVTKDELFDALRSRFKDDLPETAFEKIRLAIRDQFPGKYIKGAGRTPG
jgi:hypothetical protein